MHSDGSSLANGENQSVLILSGCEGLSVSCLGGRVWLLGWGWRLRSRSFLLHKSLTLFSYPCPLLTPSWGGKISHQTVLDSAPSISEQPFVSCSLPQKRQQTLLAPAPEQWARGEPQEQPPLPPIWGAGVRPVAPGSGVFQPGGGFCCPRLRAPEPAHPSGLRPGSQAHLGRGQNLAQTARS